MRRLVAFVLLMAVGVLPMIANARPATACSCAGIFEAGAVAGLYDNPNQLLFLGEETETRDYDGFEVPSKFRVDKVYGGPFNGDELRVSDELTSCSTGSMADRGQAVFRASRFEGEWHLGACGNAYDPGLIETLLDGSPEPTSNAPPEFVVSHELGVPLMAALDADARLVAYGYGPGKVEALAPCPGNRFIAAVVSPSPLAGTTATGYELQLRDLPDLELVRIAPLPIYPDSDAEGQVERSVRFLDCHDPVGSLITYVSALESTTYPSRTSSAELHVARTGDVSTIDVGPVIAATVHGPSGLAYGILRGERRNVHTWDIITGQLVGVTELPVDHAGWHLGTRGTDITVLTGGRPPDDRANNQTISSRLIGPIDQLEVHPIVEGAHLVSTIDAGSRTVLASAERGRGPELFLLDGEHRLTPLTNSPSPIYTSRAAAGSKAVLVGDGSWESIGVYRSESSERDEIRGIGHSSAMVSLIATQPQVNAPEPNDASLPPWIPNITPQVAVQTGTNTQLLGLAALIGLVGLGLFGVAIANVRRARSPY